MRQLMHHRIYLEEKRMKWIKTVNKLLEEKMIVQTKIDDGKDCRNITQLYRYKNLWFFQMVVCMFIIHLLTGDA